MAWEKPLELDDWFTNVRVPVIELVGANSIDGNLGGLVGDVKTHT